MKRHLKELRDEVEEAARPLYLVAMSWLMHPKQTEKLLPRKEKVKE